jgi:hypothetical protein
MGGAIWEEFAVVMEPPSGNRSPSSLREARLKAIAGAMLKSQGGKLFIC